MNKGKVVLVPFPFTDLSGHKIRPAVIISDYKNSEDLVVVFISSQKSKKSHPFDLEITKDEVNNLKVDSHIKCSKIATLDKKIILGEIGELSKKDLKKLDEKLKEVFGL
jgi:mRNA interferase MazF